MLAVDTQSLFSAAQETASIGNKAAASSQVLLTSDKAVVTFIGVRWDGDKVRGIRMELSDGSFKQAGGYDDSKYTLTQYRFVAGETLISARLRDSGYGYGSLRQVAFETSLKHAFNAGADGFDHEASLAVEGAELVGFHAWLNSDNSSTRLPSSCARRRRSPLFIVHGSRRAPSAILRPLEPRST